MIIFNFEDTRFTFRDRRKLKKWLEDAIREEMKLIGTINFIFCTDEFLHNLNVEYLSHDTLTDVITFDYSEEGRLSGDIFISIPRVRENALNFAPSFIDELHRVMIHGVLHLVGYKDKSKKHAVLMRKREDYYLLKRW